MEKTTRAFKRKQYLVAKKFQLKYVGLILLLMFLTAALCSYVVYYTSMLLLGEKLANVYPQGRLVHIVKAVNFRILLSVILVSPLVALIGIFLSHRIAGPIARMERFLNDLAKGDLKSRLVLRRKDELISLANGINYVVDSLRDSVLEKKAHMKEVSQELENLKKAMEAKPIDQALINDVVNRLSNELKALHRVLERYRL